MGSFSPGGFSARRISAQVASVLAYVLYFSLLARASDGALVFEAGRSLRTIDEAQARAEGLSIIDLGSGFVPLVLRDVPSLGERGHQPYAEVYRAFADERFDDVPESARAEEERYLELYGIFPSFRVLKARIGDSARHACHAAIDVAPLADYPNRLWQLPPLTAGTKPSAKTAAKRAAHAEAVKVVQARLGCDGLLPKQAKPGQYDMWTAEAVRMFQKRHMIISWGIVDEPTRAALLADSRELDFRSALRALRERVVAATGLIEDGSATADSGTVLGRQLDPPDLAAIHAYGALPNGAPDLISQATQATARALGWTGPDELAHWLAAHDVNGELKVALPLPALPAYHRAHMELRVVIDRGEVHYGYPYDEAGNPIPQLSARRPTLTLFAKDGDHEVALARWNTTIGGWQPENLPDGSVGLMYKNSEVGERVFRQVIATPAWLPPDSTPDRDLLRKGPGKPKLNREIIGPGFASAYGLAMMPLEIEWKPRDGRPPSYVDRGVRAHGSVSYRSILKGYSHGCHRLFNHLAIRMASFLIAHRDHTPIGRLPVVYMRTVKVDDVARTIKLDHRGFGYELTPPVPVSVLEGKIKGLPKQPIETGMPLPPNYKP